MMSSLFAGAQPADGKEGGQNRWEQIKQQEVSAETLLQTYREIRDDKRLTATEKQWNDCYFILETGEYFGRQKGEVKEAKKLLNQIPEIDLKHPQVEAFMEKTGMSRFVNACFMLRAIRQGASFDEARDGIDITTELPVRPLNRYDYEKLKVVFETGGEKLQTLYLNKMQFIFRNHGCTDELLALQPVIEKQIPEIPARQTVLDLYARYKPLRPGNPAPLTVLQDASGKSYRWSDFAGKVIVVDVWATWCCECVERMPGFLELRQAYAGNPGIVFLSVSIDRRDAWEKWEKALEKYNMTPMLNLIAVAGESTFESDYGIFGIPRHIVIDKKGNIVDVFAPLKETELQEMIERVLK